MTVRLVRSHTQPNLANVIRTSQTLWFREVSLRLSGTSAKLATARVLQRFGHRFLRRVRNDPLGTPATRDWARKEVMRRTLCRLAIERWRDGGRKGTVSVWIGVGALGWETVEPGKQAVACGMQARGV